MEAARAYATLGAPTCMPTEWFAFFSFKSKKMKKEPQISLQDLQSKMDQLTTMLESGGSNAQRREWSIQRSTLAPEINAAKKVAIAKDKQRETLRKKIPPTSLLRNQAKSSKRILCKTPKTRHPLIIALFAGSSTARKTASASLSEEASFCIRKEAPASIRKATSSSVGETAPAAR